MSSAAPSRARGSAQVGVDEERTADRAELVEDRGVGAGAEAAQLEVVRPELLELPRPEPDHLPACRPQRPVLAPVGVLPLAHVLEPVPAGAVVLDGDPQL